MSSGQTRSHSTSAPIPQGVLLGLGNPLLDITVKADDSSLLQRYGLQANNAVIATPEQTTLFKELMANSSAQYSAGGATQNSIRVAQWLLHTRGATTFFGGVGDDEAAAILRSKAEDAGVTVRYCASDRAPTGTCGVVITGENRSLVARLGAAELLTHEWIRRAEEWSLVEKAQYYYIGGFVFPVCPEGVFDIARHACEHNKTLVMNLSAPFLCKHYASEADGQPAIMQYVDILFGNESEAAEFCRLKGLKVTDIHDMARQTSLLPKANTRRSRLVVFTQGRDPTVVARDGEVRSYDINPVAKEMIRDTNGCGDAFVGGFLSQLVQGRSLDECVRCGNYAARYVIQQWGCLLPEPPSFS